ncbi:DUF6461 domain-containing protein [Streptomyces pratensis]|uniref:DUF6461 domain-containing protein n=1 Tax=Streptomyces pratensis TaxID=1169025 RepID=UPI001EE4D782|nr:DUF6461 domain-containing protein [Streptomyces pratensis]
MGDGIQWMVGSTTSSGWMLDVHFARGIDSAELALRMGAPLGSGTQPMTDAEMVSLDVDAYPDRGPSSAVVRAGEHSGWAFAITYGPYLNRLDEVSRDGVEAVHYHYNSEHPPTTVLYARDGRTVCGFGLSEEHHRYGHDPDLLLPDLVAAGILRSDGKTYCDPDIDDYNDRDRRGLAIFEERFGLSLPRTVLTEDPLPVYAIMGSPAPDFEAIYGWAASNGRPLPNERLRLIPAGLRNDYERTRGWNPRGRLLTGDVGPGAAIGPFHTSGTLRDPAKNTER